MPSGQGRQARKNFVLNIAYCGKTRIDECRHFLEGKIKNQIFKKLSKLHTKKSEEDSDSPI
jgi:hypothetical protein